MTTTTDSLSAWDLVDAGEVPAWASDEYRDAVEAGRDAWVPASGGTETPFRTRSGRRFLYVFNPAQGRHAYLDLEADLVLDDEEALAALGH